MSWPATLRLGERSWASMPTTTVPFSSENVRSWIRWCSSVKCVMFMKPGITFIRTTIDANKAASARVSTTATRKASRRALTAVARAGDTSAAEVHRHEHERAEDHQDPDDVDPSRHGRLEVGRRPVLRHDL